MATSTWLDLPRSLDGPSFTCRAGKDDIELEAMITDADFFVDALFNSLGSQSGATELYQVWSCAASVLY